MKPKLFFGISLNFDLTTNEHLSQLSALKMWDRGLQKYLYIFPANQLNEVIALTGKELDFNEEKKDIINLIQHSPILKEEIVTDKYKGEGYVYIQRFPKMFRVRTIMRKQEHTFDIPIETVKTMWKVIRTLKLNEKVKTRVIAEKQIKELGITRFHKDSGYFNFNTFFGERSDYMRYLYFPLKVLQDANVINYYKTGHVERIAEGWKL